MPNYTAWYWKFIPHYREVYDPYLEEDQQTAEFMNKELEPNLEYRDEANRKWYQFFDEYEYRYNEHTRKNKVWWSWFDKNATKAEKKLVLKLDFMIVLYTIGGFWSLTLDSTNLTNAFVSGMREDLNMVGDELSTATATFSAGQVSFQILFMYIFPRLPLNYLFFATNLLWSLITILSANVQNAQQLYVSRFFCGAAESSFFVQVHYLLGNVYTASEISSRGGLFYTGLMLGGLTSGLLQGQIYQSLNGVLGKAGWRWIFIIDGAITIPIAFYGLYAVPGTPENCYSLFLTDEEILLSRKRLRDANIVPPSKNPPPFLDFNLWKKILTSWQIYVLMIFDGLFWNCSGPIKNSGFPLWLDSLKRYSTPELNRITSIPSALGIAIVLAVCLSADIFKSRSAAILFGTAMTLTSSAILAAWDVPESALWYAFYICYFGYSISSVLYGWLNDIMRHDPQERAIVLCAANIFSAQSIAWLVPVAFPTSEGPRFKKGYRFATSVDAVLLAWTVLTFVLYKRQERKDARKNGIVLYNSAKGDIPEEVAEYLASQKNDTETDTEKVSINAPNKE
ncbi:putative transporter SEO1 [Wickerhamomyces ciferrii]|uniref:Transporter SEO1 n=1 Tax=Wickerhamomyces ciferrii (strain ATCC 14091 / BCRC 22168 / CBS 111 / JCM 3599 / NBRC 0793 / NRRL Y-1031 F-60-10) TaxID=1206466 RepID=K0KNN6_WICCF|nr:putative transporter SEO1 [Wickerhamomyces ciferrii]CCH46880.1 putative transporter SEO1 [Wickerhamomyces ciferrii]